MKINKRRKRKKMNLLRKLLRKGGKLVNGQKRQPASNHQQNSRGSSPKNN